MIINERIKNTRKEKGISQKELGELLGVSQQMIGQWEKTGTNLTLETIQRIASALEVSLAELTNTVEDIAKFSSSAMIGAAENIGETIIDIPKSMQILSKDEQILTSDYRKLNNTGKEEARKRVNELTEIPRYTKKDSDS